MYESNQKKHQQAREETATSSPLLAVKLNVWGGYPRSCHRAVGGQVPIAETFDFSSWHGQKCVSNCMRSISRNCCYRSSCLLSRMISREDARISCQQIIESFLCQQRWFFPTQVRGRIRPFHSCRNDLPQHQNRINLYLS
jgi:hypothetical protein